MRPRLNPSFSSCLSKLALCGLVGCLPLLGFDGQRTETVLKTITGQDFKVISSKKEPLAATSFAIVEGPGGSRFAALVSDDGELILPLQGLTPLGVKDTNSALELALFEVEKHNRNMQETSALALLNKYDKRLLKLPSSNPANKVTKIYMILDTRCPYCAQKVEQLDSYLDKGAVEVLIVGILGEKSSARAAGYYAELAAATTTAKKKDLLKKVFDPKYTPGKKLESIESEISKAALDAGITSVPFIVVR